MTEPALSVRPLCAEVSQAADEPLAATASRVEHWLLIEYGGYWPFEPLDATIFAGRLREHLATQLRSLRNSRLCLVKQPGRFRRDRVRVFYGSTPERGGRFFTLELEGHPDLLDLDFAAALAGDRAVGAPLEHPLLLVCTHGKRDRCCARYGQPLCEALHRGRSSAWVWQASHVGGDRFAGNIVCLPDGLYFGRVDADDVERLVDSYRIGRIALDRYRGRSCYAFAVQAAELEVRRRTGLDGLHALRLVGSRKTDERAWAVEFRTEVAGDVHAVDVTTEWGPETYLTCRAERPRRARRHVVRAYDVRPG